MIDWEKRQARWDKWKAEQKTMTPKELEAINRMEAYGGHLYKYPGGWSEMPPRKAGRESWHWSCSSQTINKLLAQGLIVRIDTNTVALNPK